jgi:DNA sulfur modification protein DndD
MKIRKVRLNNFRPFYGEQELDFALDTDRNVTLIHAENEFGKTSILSSILWCLYHQVTAGFEQRDRIINDDAYAEGAMSARVEVEFEYNDQIYLVQREFNFFERGRDKTKLFISRIESGNHIPLNVPETFISSVIPSEMAKYFFFGGEDAVAYSSEANNKDVGRAIRNILGCATAETAIDDLKDLTREIDREIGKIHGDDELKTIENEITKIDEEYDTSLSLQDSLEEEIKTRTYQRDLIIQQLRESEGAKHLQELRDEKQNELSRIKSDIKESKSYIINWISQKALHVISRRLSQTTLDFIDEASIKGRIPSPYNEEFVQGLLDSEECICHRPLKAGTQEWGFVADLLRDAANAEIMGRVVRARARVQQLREGASSAPDSLLQSERKLGVLIN